MERHPDYIVYPTTLEVMPLERAVAVASAWVSATCGFMTWGTNSVSQLDWNQMPPAALCDGARFVQEGEAAVCAYHLEQTRIDYEVIDCSATARPIAPEQ
jgi:hypothetical protein